ncbi:MAG: efflux RND transporter periplasmic adaptor subunit [Spirochaetia bacterium]|nr:efflux RND transporter periplasmic adaptor subunit [Spirochaetia bacterium]
MTNDAYCKKEQTWGFFNKSMFKARFQKTLSLCVSLAFFLLLFLPSASCSKEEKKTNEEGYYTCPMHPQVIEDKPGRCPICKMHLKFVKSEESSQETHQGHEHAGHENGSEEKQSATNAALSEKEENKRKDSFQFSLSAAALGNAGITTVAAEKKKFEIKSVFSGHVDYNEDPKHLVVINTKYDGWIETLNVSKEGQYVKKGETLFGVYSPQILAAKEEYLTTYQSVKELYQNQKKSANKIFSDPTLISARRKLLYLDVSLAQINNIENKETVSRVANFQSPISGAVISKNMLKGSHIKSGQEVMRIADLSRLWVYIHIFEKDLSFVSKGLVVDIKSAAYSQKKFTGRVDMVYPYLEHKTKDIKVRIEIENKEKLLKPGMFVEVNVSKEISKEIVVIPESSIIFSGEKKYVFVSLGGGKFEIRPVVVIAMSNSLAAVSEGVKEKELVATKGQFLLDSEASLKEALQKGSSAAHAH